jgi:sugar lactone lactonase YvrE
LGNDGLVYTCDRGQNRVQVFDKKGTLIRVIPIDPPEYLNATLRADDIELSRDADQRWLFVVDLGSNRIWILERASGEIVGSIGGSGHMAGEFTFPHTIVMDSHGDLYIAETIGGRRHQKFRREISN